MANRKRAPLPGRQFLVEGIGRVWGKEQDVSHAGRTLRYVSTPHLAAANLRLSQELEGHEGCINCINFNQKGNLLASGSDDTCVGVWRVENDAPGALKYKLLAKLDAWHEGNLFGVCFFPHRDDLVASSAADGTVRLSTIERPTRPLLRGWSDHVGMVHEVAPWGPHTLLSAGDDGRVILRDLRVPVRNRFGQLRVRPTARDELSPPTRPVPTAREALDRSPSGSLYCHRVPKGGVTSMDVHPTRPEYIVLGGRHRYSRFLDMRQCFAGSTAGSASSGGGSDTNRGPSPVVTFLDTAPLQPQNLSRCHVTGVRFSPQGDRIATTSSDGYVLVFDTAGAHQAAMECNGFGMDPYTASSIFVNDQAPSLDHWAADLRPHALPISDDEYPLFFPKEGLQSWNLRWMSVQARDWLDSGAPAPTEEDDGDEGHMESDAPASHEEQVAKVSPKPPALRGILHTQTVKEVGWMGPRGEFVVAGSSCGHVLLWDTTAERMPLVRAMKADNHIANCVRTHPDQHRYVLATAGIDNELRLWCPQPAGSHWSDEDPSIGGTRPAEAHTRTATNAVSPPRGAYAVGRRALKHAADSSRRALREVDERPPAEEEEGAWDSSATEQGRRNFSERLRQLLHRSGIVVTSVAPESGSEEQEDGEGGEREGGAGEHEQHAEAGQGSAATGEGAAGEGTGGGRRGGGQEEDATDDEEEKEENESATSPAEVPVEDTTGPRTQESVEDDDDDGRGRGGRETPPSPSSLGSARSEQQEQGGGDGGSGGGEAEWAVESSDSDDGWDDWRPDGEANAIGTVLSAQRLYELTKRNEERTVARGGGVQATLRAQFDLLEMLLRMRNPNQFQRG